MEARLNGFFRPDYVSADRTVIRIGQPLEGVFPAGDAPLSQLEDGRRLQAPAASEAAFFAEHGFALLPHETAVTDWDPPLTSPFTPNDIDLTYAPEVQAVIRERLLPGRRLEFQMRPQAIRRGPGTATPQYGEGVHNDFGLTADDYQENLEAYASPEIAGWWRARYEAPDVEGFMVINFWRTVRMEGPLAHMPLAICDPATVAARDVVPTGLADFAPSGKLTNQVSLRYNSGQRWVYYPDMVGGEVLAFKVFQCFKGETLGRLATCFHVAFADPAAPADTPPRQSCEMRVGLFLLRD
jgi:hypothetical protein